MHQTEESLHLPVIYHIMTYSVYGKDAIVIMQEKKEVFLKLQLTKDMRSSIKDLHRCRERASP